MTLDDVIAFVFGGQPGGAAGASAVMAQPSPIALPPISPSQSSATAGVPGLPGSPSGQAVARAPTTAIPDRPVAGTPYQQPVPDSQRVAGGQPVPPSPTTTGGIPAAPAPSLGLPDQSRTFGEKAGSVLAALSGPAALTSYNTNIDARHKQDVSRFAANKTFQWLASQGMDETGAAAAASNPTLLKAIFAAKAAGTAPSNVREWQYFSQLSPEQQQQYLTMKRSEKYLDVGTGFVRPNPVAPGESTSVVSKDLAGKTSQEQSGKDIAKRRDDALGAVKSLNNIATAKDILRSGIISGAGADWMLSGGKVLEQLGISGATLEQRLANTQVYAAHMGNQVAQIIKQFGSGTGLSDADREYAEKIVAGRITLDKDAMLKLLDIQERIARVTIKQFNEDASRVEQGRGARLTVDEPAAASGNASDPIGLR